MAKYPQIKRSRYTRDIVIFIKPIYGYIVTNYYDYGNNRPNIETRWNYSSFTPIKECTIEEYNKIVNCIIENKLSGVSICIK